MKNKTVGSIAVSRRPAAAEKKRTGIFRSRTGTASLVVMLIPGLICMLAFSYLPMIGILIAFKKVNYAQGIFNSDWIGLKNFEFFLATPDAFVITRNTILYNLAFIFLGLFVAVACAIALNEIRSKFARNFYQTAMFLPYFLSWVTVSFLVFAFLNPDYGFINKQILERMGIDGILWYNEPKYWPFIIIFLNLWKMTGYSSLIYFAALTGSDLSLYEAAAIDGATRWKQIRYITIPSLIPLMIIMTILNVGKIFHADFGLFFQTTLDSGTLYPVTNVLDTYVFRSLKTSGEIGMSAAAGLYQAVCGFILVISTNLIVRKIDPDSALF